MLLIVLFYIPFCVGMFGVVMWCVGVSVHCLVRFWVVVCCVLFVFGVVYLVLLWMGYCDVCDFPVVGFGGYGNCGFVRLPGCGVIVLWWSVVLMGFAVYG